MARRQLGFTLVELLIALAIGSITLAALYNFYHAQQRTIDMREQIAAMQQSARIAMDIMTREIRMAGYDPINKVAGFVTDFTPPSGNPIPDPPVLYTNHPDGTPVIAFTMNLDLADPSISSSANNVQEEFAYQLNGNVLERYEYDPNNLNDPWKDVASNIQELKFVCRDKNGNLTAIPANIRTVEIILVARTERPDHQGDYKTYTLRSTIKPRNL